MSRLPSETKRPQTASLAINQAELDQLAVSAQQASFGSARPTLPLCPKCRKQFGTASLPLHVSKCKGLPEPPPAQNGAAQRPATAKRPSRPASSKPQSSQASASSHQRPAGSSSRPPSALGSSVSARKLPPVPREPQDSEGGFTRTGSLRREALALAHGTPAVSTTVPTLPSALDLSSASVRRSSEVIDDTERKIAANATSDIESLDPLDSELPGDDAVGSLDELDDASSVDNAFFQSVIANRDQRAWLHPNVLNTHEEAKQTASASGKRTVPSLVQLCLVELSKQLHVIKWEDEFFQSAAQSALLGQLPPNFLSGIILAQAHRLQVLRKAAFPAKPQSVVSLEHQLKVLHAEVVLLRRSKATFTAQARQFDQTVRELRDREEVHLREIAALQAQVNRLEKQAAAVESQRVALADKLSKVAASKSS